MYTRSQALQSGSTVLDFQFLKPSHSYSPSEAFEIAKTIRNKYLLERNNLSQKDAVNKLLENPKILHFASESCFPKLFLLACDEEDCLNAIENLVMLRKSVDEGKINENEASLAALYLAAEAKEKKFNLKTK